MKNLIKEKFKALFDKTPLLVYSPGRINLIGEHTDYNEGFVMPAAIDKKMIVGIAKNDSTQARVYSLDFDEEFTFDTQSFGPRKGHWATYIMGVTAQLIQAGYPVKGFDIVFGGDIPVGAGLSSSAALEAATTYAISSLFGFDIPKISIIHYSQKAEHIFAGVQCGIMDQFASVMGKKGHVIRLDCRSLEYEYFSLKLGDYKLVLVDSKVKHSLADSAYNRRRLECEEGVIKAKSFAVQTQSLRDMDFELLEKIKPTVNHEVYSRCRYVIEENNRVLKASEYLDKNDLKAFGKLMYETHDGLSKLYEVSCKELDWLVEQTLDLDYVLGSRMMGGGFGGCTINIIHKAYVDDFLKRINRDFYKSFGKKPEFHQVSLENGTGILC